jgi:peptidoglycan/xylan/chitin deacetylase (PgdA/CDA1 family)
MKSNMSIRKDFISFTSPVSAALPLDLLCKLTGENFIIPFYHVVSDEDCPHIEHLYRYKSQKEFTEDIDWLAKRYQPIGADALPDVLAGKYKGKKIMLLTFDDGLRQMYDVVAPILVRKGMPAVFFLNTDFIDNKALMFRYKASVLKSLNKGNATMFDARSDKELDAQINLSQREELNAFLTGYKPYMTSVQIKSLISQGFAIGAHSCSHPYFADLTLDKQLAETLDSMDILQNDYGIKEKLFAFPFTDYGVSRAFFDHLFNEKKIDFSFGGAGIKHDTHPRQFQRIPMEGWNASAEQILKSEYLYCLLRAPLGKNTIVRN